MRSKRKLIILLSSCPFFCLPQANKHVTLLSSCFQVYILFRISFFDANVIIVSRLFWFLLATKFDSSSIVLMESIRSLGTLSFHTVHGVAFFFQSAAKICLSRVRVGLHVRARVCVGVCLYLCICVYVCVLSDKFSFSKQQYPLLAFICKLSSFLRTFFILPNDSNVKSIGLHFARFLFVLFLFLFFVCFLT